MRIFAQSQVEAYLLTSPVAYVVHESRQLDIDFSTRGRPMEWADELPRAPPLIPAWVWARNEVPKSCGVEVGGWGKGKKVRDKAYGGEA